MKTVSGILLSLLETNAAHRISFVNGYSMFPVVWVSYPTVTGVFLSHVVLNILSRINMWISNTSVPLTWNYVLINELYKIKAGGSDGKESACNAGDQGSVPGSGRSPGEGNGNPLQYSCLENSMDRGAWQATVHGVAKSWTRLNN